MFKTSILTLALLLPFNALAQEPGSQCEGSLYRAKTEGVPVYSEADEATEVLANLKLGQKVCYIGEDNSKSRKFAILDWRGESSNKNELAFALLSDLWPPKEAKTKKPELVGAAGILQKASNYLQRMRSGHPPTDALEPYKRIFKRPKPQPELGGEDCSVDSGDEDCGLEREKSKEIPRP